MCSFMSLSISFSSVLDLIDNHKRIHGDTPFTRVQPPEAQRSSRAHGTILGHSYGSRGRNDPPQNHGSWKRKYSLRHKSPQSAHPFISTSCNHRDATPPVSSGGAPHSPRDVTRTTATVTTNVSRKAEPLVPRHEHSKAESCSATEGTQLMAESRRVFPPGSTDPNRRHRLAPVATAAPAVLTTITPSVAALPKLAKQRPSNLSSHSGHCQTTKSVSTNSKFVWVKTQNVKGQSSSVSTPAGKTGNDLPPSKPGAESTVASTVWKKTPGKKPPRRLTQVSVSPKASKYKWVSSYAQSKISRKSMSSKLPLPQRALETDDTLRKAKTALTCPAKTKKEVATSSRSSHYSWKAVAAAGPAVPRRSSFYWTPDKRRVREGFSSGTLRTILPCPPSSSCSPGPFKLHSQMKIIRRSANSGSEKVSSTPGGRLTTPGRPPASLRGPTGARRTSSRELVSFGRHKLRRLVTSVTRTSPPSTFSSGALPDFGSSRYRSRRGPSAAHAHQDPPSLSWRARRVQSARSFLQSRLRTHQDTHPSSPQHWRGGSMCWIRGSLYRVSANKLSRTVASGPAVNRTGKSFSSTQTSMMTWNRCSSTRHLASRAVQRSLAIIRQARQKKQAKQYCMYYNRFGKCNRGNSCPYIHDPDKVAVCTRFLRGTCKKAEGICPFSHKVAKEKVTDAPRDPCVGQHGGLWDL
uniref:Zinc finger CCCH-type containing 3 n=1 Tax=Takifugu rubripes TaxID=31033 RepID=A0A674PET2_TAKRU